MIAKIGSHVINLLQFFIYAIGYFGKIVRSVPRFIVRGKASRKILTLQFLFTFEEALGIVSVSAVGIGTAVLALGYSFLLSIGQPGLIFTSLILIITRELGPVLIAFIVTARSATAIATEIGSMVISHEIEAYIAIGVDPVDHLAVPRFLGVIGSTFLLNIYFSLIGLIAPIAVMQLINPMSAPEYFNALLRELSIRVLTVSIVKSIIFGMIISTVSTLYGFFVERSSTEIPRAGLSAVGTSFLLIIIFDALITVFSYVL